MGLSKNSSKFVLVLLIAVARNGFAFYNSNAGTAAKPRGAGINQLFGKFVGSDAAACLDLKIWRKIFSHEGYSFNCCTFLCIAGGGF